MIDFLRQFYPISENSFQKIISECTNKFFSKNEIILKEGEIQKELFFVEEGVQMSYFYHNDKKHVLAFTYPPYLSGVPDSFFSQKASKVCLESMSRSTVLSIEYDVLNNLIEEDKEIAYLFKKLTEALLEGTIQRTMELKAYSIEERFKAFVKRSPHLFQLVPHKYIASYLNISEGNFSKLYNSIRF